MFDGAAEIVIQGAAYKFLMSFALDNDLAMRPGRIDVRPEPSIA